jgi:hypothetical protein
MHWIKCRREWLEAGKGELGNAQPYDGPALGSYRKKDEPGLPLGWEGVEVVE